MSSDKDRQELNGLPAQGERESKHILRTVVRAYQGDPTGYSGTTRAS